MAIAIRDKFENRADLESFRDDFVGRMDRVGRWADRDGKQEFVDIWGFVDGTLYAVNWVADDRSDRRGSKTILRIVDKTAGKKVVDLKVRG